MTSGFALAASGDAGSEVEDSSAHTIRLFIIAEVRLYRDGLAEIIGREPDIEVVGTRPDGLLALPDIAGVLPDVILLEVVGPRSLLAARAIRRVVPNAGVVALAMMDTEEVLVACALAGVTGFSTREQSLVDLAAVVHRVAQGEMVCPPRVAGALLRHVAALGDDRQRADPTAHLTSRELEIAELIQQGHSNKEIARTLHIELATVKTHVHRILEKMGVRRRGQAAARMHALRVQSLRY